MEVDHILVLFESPDGRNLWKPVPREDIPDWLRTPAIFDRLIAGEQVRNSAEKTERHFRVIEVDRPRPAGQHKARLMSERIAQGLSPGGIALQ